MSLYLGKDDVNDPILHITSDTQTKATLQNDKVSTTTYHSKYALFSCTLFNATNVYAGSNGTKVCIFDSELYALADSYPNLFNCAVVNNSTVDVRPVGFANGQTALATVAWYRTRSSAADDPVRSTAYDRVMYPSSTYRYARIHTSYTGTNIALMVSNFTEEGLIPPLQPLDNTVQIDQNDIVIGQRSLKATKYLSAELLNASDYIINTNGRNYQLINSVLSGSNGTVEINGNSALIKGSDGSVLFSSDSPFNLKYDGRYTTTAVVSVGFGGSGTFFSNPVSTGLSEGDLILVRVPYGSDKDNFPYYSTYFMSYAEDSEVEIEYSYSTSLLSRGWLVTKNGSLFLKRYYNAPYAGGTYNYTLTYEIFKK